MDAIPSCIASIRYISSYKLKNPKPVAKLVEDEEAWMRLIADVKAYIDSFVRKHGAAHQVKPFVITIIDTLDPVNAKENKVSAPLPRIRSPVQNCLIYPEFIILKEEEEGL